MQKTEYQIISQNDSKKLTQFLCKEGRLLLPMVELITQAEMAIDELIGVTGRAAIESLPLTEGSYNLSSAITIQDSLTNYDYLPHSVSFRVIEKHSYKVIREHGIVCIPCEWEVSLNGKRKLEECC